MKLRDVELVVITGAGGGIGRATALRFAQSGSTIVCLDIDRPAALETADLVERAGGQSVAYKLDVSDPAAYRRVAARIHAQFGVPDVVVNNAGIVKIGGSISHSPGDWDAVLGVNLSGVVYGCQLFGAQMVERGKGGHLVNIASVAAFMPSISAPSYSVSKAGVRMLSESLRAELASDGIGVSVVCPGAIDTGIWRSAGFLRAGADEQDRRNVMLGGFVSLASKVGLASQPDVVARAILRSVERNHAVVLVRPEAWLVYGLSRLAPGLLLAGARLTGENLIEGVAARLHGTLVGRILRRAGSSAA